MPRLSKRTLAQYLTKLRHQKQTVDDGRGGPREFLYVSLIVSSYFVMYWVSVQKWTLCTISQMGREKDVPRTKVVFSSFVVNGNYGRWGIGTVLPVITASRPRTFFGMGFSTDPIPCF